MKNSVKKGKVVYSSRKELVEELLFASRVPPITFKRVRNTEKFVLKFPEVINEYLNRPTFLDSFKYSIKRLNPLDDEKLIEVFERLYPQKLKKTKGEISEDEIEEYLDNMGGIVAISHLIAQSPKQKVKKDFSSTIFNQNPAVISKLKEKGELSLGPIIHLEDYIDLIKRTEYISKYDAVTNAFIEPFKEIINKSGEDKKKLISFIKKELDKFQSKGKEATVLFMILCIIVVVITIIVIALLSSKDDGETEDGGTEDGGTEDEDLVG